MRALSVHPDVVVLVSSIWQTTATAVRAGEEGFLIDSPVLPEELAALPGVIEQAGFPVSGLLATHADWDHLLGRLAFPDTALGVAESSAARLAAEPGAAQRSLRDFDRKHYIERPAAAVAWRHPGAARARTPRAGHRSGARASPADGHTQDGMAIWIPWAKVLVCGDYLSPVEAPIVGGSTEAYLATLERLRGLVAESDTVVPGHGRPLDREAASRVLEEHAAGATRRLS